jgi:hypothetical protein
MNQHNRKIADKNAKKAFLDDNRSCGIIGQNKTIFTNTVCLRTQSICMKIAYKYCLRDSAKFANCDC